MEWRAAKRMHELWCTKRRLQKCKRVVSWQQAESPDGSVEVGASSCQSVVERGAVRQRCAQESCVLLIIINYYYYYYHYYYYFFFLSARQHKACRLKILI